VARKDTQVAQSGERTNIDGKPVSNIILLSTSDSDYSSLRPHLEYVSLPNWGFFRRRSAIFREGDQQFCDSDQESERSDAGFGIVSEVIEMVKEKRKECQRTIEMSPCLTQIMRTLRPFPELPIDLRRSSVLLVRVLMLL